MVEFSKSKNWPSIFGIDMRPLPLFVVGALAPEGISGYFFLVGVVLMLIFFLSKIMGVNSLTMFRKFRRLLIGDRLVAYPITKQTRLKN